MKENIYKLPYFLIEAFLYLLRENSSRTTTEIYEYVEKRLNKGDFLSKNKESNRKTLLKALKELENLGLVESKKGSGRKPTLWKISTKVFKEKDFLISEDEIIQLLVFLAFIPNEYRELPFFQSTMNLVERLSQKIDIDKVKLIKNSFFHEPRFTTRFSPVKEEMLKAVVNAIMESKCICVIKDGKERIIWPVNLFSFNGNLYVGALKPIKEKNRVKFPFRSYKLSSIKLCPSQLSKACHIPKPSKSEMEENRKNAISFQVWGEEIPFFFGVKLPNFIKLGQEEKVFSTQFHSNPKENIIYLVGFTHPIFYNDFLSKDFIKVIPPNEEIKKIAKIKKVKEFLKKEVPFLNIKAFSYELHENKRRFKVFREGILKLLNQKQKAF